MKLKKDGIQVITTNNKQNKTQTWGWSLEQKQGGKGSAKFLPYECHATASLISRQRPIVPTAQYSDGSLFHPHGVRCTNGSA